MKFKKKVVFISGSNRGIGKSILSLFASEGAEIIAHARSYSDTFEQELMILESRYAVKVTSVYFDLNNIPSQSILRELMPNLKKLDVLVNNAGIIHSDLLQMTMEEDINKVFDTNVFSILKLTQRLIPYLRKGQNPSIVNISSINSFDLEIGNSLYGVSKAAVNAITKTLYKELAPLNIRVNAVAPGLVDTDMAKKLEPKAFQKALDKTLLHQPISPDAIAKVVLFLGSDDSMIINGEIIRCDGGRI